MDFQLLYWHWLVIGMLLIIGEIFVASFTMFWFGLGGLVVALVLGAGNVSSIGPMDLLYKLFVDNQVVALKVHPVNDYLGPLLAEGFQTLRDWGVLRIVYGGVDVGSSGVVDVSGDEEPLLPLLGPVAHRREALPPLRPRPRESRW